MFVSLSKENFLSCFPLVEKEGRWRNRKLFHLIKRKGKKKKSHSLTMSAKANWSGCCLCSCLQMRKSCWKLAQTTNKDAWLFSGFDSHSETLWGRALFVHCSRKWILGLPLGYVETEENKIMTMAISSFPLWRHVWPCCHQAAPREIQSLRIPFIAGMVWVDTNACSFLTFLGQEQAILNCVWFLPQSSSGSS